MTWRRLSQHTAPQGQILDKGRKHWPRAGGLGGRLGRVEQGQIRVGEAWREGELVGGLGLGGGLDQPPTLRPAPTPLLPSSLALHRAAQICTNNFTGADPSSSIAVAGTILGVRGHEFPYSELHYSHLQPCCLVCLFQCRMGLGCPSSTAVVATSGQA